MYITVFEVNMSNNEYLLLLFLKRIKTIHNYCSKFKSPVFIHLFTKYMSRLIINKD